MPININLISDFNLELLKRVIESKKNNDFENIFTSSYGQFYQSIFLFKIDLNTINFVWSLPESHIKSFQKALNFEEINKNKLIEEVKYMQIY